jgi:hypothetical protein
MKRILGGPLMVIFVLLSWAFAHGCASARSSPRVAAPERARESSESAASVRFFAGYPATLFYALDAAAGERNRDAGYRAWLVGDEPAPWLAAYAERRQEWSESTRPDHGGGASTFDICGWEAHELEDAIRCLDGVLGESDRQVAVTALRAADRRLRPRWTEIGAHIVDLVPDLEQELHGPTARALLRTLRETAGLPEDAALQFNVVLVAKPPGAHSFARQAGQFLVHEVRADETAGHLLAIAFHEIAHLAHFMSPRREEMERAFLPLGDSGKLAGNVWDEVVATAFGNGLAASHLDPEFRVSRSFYTDPWIDALGRALYREWQAGLDVRLGPQLAARLTQLVDQEWPENQRPLARYLWYVTVYAQERALLREVLRGVEFRGAARTTPIIDALPPGPKVPPWAPRLVLITVDELARREGLVSRAGIPAKSWEDALAASAAAVFRHDDADGVLLLVIVARSPETLHLATPALVQLPRMVATGWTPLPIQATASRPMSQPTPTGIQEAP